MRTLFKALWKPILAMVLFCLLSPKWTFAAAAWFAPAMLLLSVRNKRPWKAFLVGASILFISGLIANYQVIPFPFAIFILITLQSSILGILPYLISRFLSRYTSPWLGTFVFPCLMVIFEYAGSFYGGGTWGSIAYTQIDQQALMQLASVTGIWGISFMVYWFSSLFVWLVENPLRSTSVRTFALSFGSILLVILVFGTFRTTTYFQPNSAAVRVVGISGTSLSLLEQMFTDVYGKKLQVDESTLTQTSPELQELNKGLMAFVENPFDVRFNNTHQKLSAFQDRMLELAAIEARAGAKIICFSEAFFFTVKPIEDSLIAKGTALAKEHGVYLILPVGAFLPGKIEPGKPYVENKALVIDPYGTVQTTFFKNKPVPLVEGSVPGDGTIPVIDTPYGRIAPSICYDADFPQLMRNAGKNSVDILFLPSGDWREIAPYHSNMARTRAIENGMSILRPVSGATSVGCDPFGKIVGSSAPWPNGTGVSVAYLPVNGVRTVYSIFGDWFILASGLFVGYAIVLYSISRIKRRF